MMRPRVLTLKAQNIQPATQKPAAKGSQKPKKKDSKDKDAKLKTKPAVEKQNHSFEVYSEADEFKMTQEQVLLQLELDAQKNQVAELLKMNRDLRNQLEHTRYIPNTQTTTNSKDTGLGSADEDTIQARERVADLDSEKVIEDLRDIVDGLNIHLGGLDTDREAYCNDLINDAGGLEALNINPKSTSQEVQIRKSTDTQPHILDSDLQGKVAELESQIRKLRGYAETRDEEIGLNQSTISALRTDYAHLQKALDMRCQELTQVTLRVQVLEKRVEDVEAQRDEVGMELAASYATLEEFGEMRTQLGVALDENKELYERVGVLETEVSDFNEAAELLEKMVEDLEKDVAERDGVIETLRDEIAVAECSIVRAGIYEHELGVTLEENRTVVGEKVMLEKRIEELESDVRDLTEAATILESQLEESETQLQLKIEECDSLNDQILAAESLIVARGVTDRTSHLEETLHENKQLVDENNALKVKVGEMESDVRDLSEAAGILESQLEETEAALQTKKEEYSDLQEQLVAVESLVAAQGVLDITGESLHDALRTKCTISEEIRDGCLHQESQTDLDLTKLISEAETSLLACKSLKFQSEILKQSLGEQESKHDEAIAVLQEETRDLREVVEGQRALEKRLMKGLEICTGKNRALQALVDQCVCGATTNVLESGDVEAAEPV